MRWQRGRGLHCEAAQAGMASQSCRQGQMCSGRASVACVPALRLVPLILVLRGAGHAAPAGTDASGLARLGGCGFRGGGVISAVASLWHLRRCACACADRICCAYC
jgi:hypothetical protein